MQVVDAIEGILEYVRGHTTLRCQIEELFLFRKTANDKVQFKAICADERCDKAKSPTALCIESMQVSITGTIGECPLDPPAGKTPITLDKLDTLVVEEIGSASYVSCHFGWTSPIGGSNGLSRSFEYRNGYLSYIS